MRKVLAICFLCVMVAAIAGCSLLADNGGTVAKGTAEAVPTEKKPLVIYFAYSENMGDTSNMDVDAITSASLHEPTENKKGNMQVMVQEIRQRTGADVYHIVVQEPYDPVFETMRDRAVEEIEQETMVKLQNPHPDLSGYDTIYFGTPVWHYTLPPAVRTFLKENDLSGKTMIPFGIHRGSEFSTNLESIQELQPNVRMADGFTIDSRTANDEVKKQFGEFLDNTLNKRK